MASPTTGDLVITIESSGNRVVVAVSGEIDVVTAPQFQGALQPLLDSRPATVVVDLTGTTFLASAGLAVLAGLAEQADPDMTVKVVAGAVVARPITLTGLDQVLNLYPTIEQASREL